MKIIKPQPGNFRLPFRFLHLGKKVSFLLLISFCFLCFMAVRKGNTVQSHQPIKSIDPEDMVRGNYYYFTDHGSGQAIVQFDHLTKGGVYTISGITPSESRFITNAVWGTTFDAGDIRDATSSEIAHLQNCVAAGRYIP